MLDEFAWVVEVAESRAALGAAGDEWFFRLSRALEAGDSGLRVTGRRYDATSPFYQVTLSDGDSDLDMVLLVANAQEGPTLVLAAGNGQLNEAALPALEAAVVRVDETLGSQGEPHDWTAIIGPSRGRISGEEVHLAHPASVSGMTLRSMETTHVEFEMGHHTFGSGALLVSTPIFVSGASIGYAWTAASQLAARDLHTLCGLMSLAFDVPFAVREAAIPLELGERSVPDRAPGTPDLPQSEFLDGPVGTPVEVPDWFDIAWNRMQASMRLRRALDAFLEGKYAEYLHPSLAAVAFTASIEVFSDKLLPRPTCSTCGVQSGISKNFKAALRLVLDESEASDLERIYTLRSKTVHSGHFHGDEVFPGAYFPGAMSGESPRDFRFGQLRRLQKVASALLQRALIDGPQSIKLEP